jgi:hypothetical protein
MVVACFSSSCELCPNVGYPVAWLARMPTTVSQDNIGGGAKLKDLSWLDLL